MYQVDKTGESVNFFANCVNEGNLQQFSFTNGTLYMVASPTCSKSIIAGSMLFLKAKYTEIYQ